MTLEEVYNQYLKVSDGFLLLGILFSILYWLAESSLHAFVFGDAAFAQSVFYPGKHELLMRLTTTLILLTFGIYAKYTIVKIKQERKKIKIAYSELDQIFNTAADAMRVVDKDFNIMRVNDTFVKLVGVKKKELIGKKCYNVFWGPHCHTPRCPLTRIKQGEKFVETDVVKEALGDKKIACIVTAKPFYDKDNKLIGVVEDYRDITERKLIESRAKIELKRRIKEKTKELEITHHKLLKTEKMAALGRMASAIAHELRNPLATIKLAVYSSRKKCNALKVKKEDKGKILKHFEHIDKEVTESDRIIHDLLTFSRIPKMNFSKANINNLISTVLRENKKCVKEHKLTVIKKFDKYLSDIKIDADKISEVFCNIFLNAAQAMTESKKKELEIVTRESDKFIEVEISDTGHGISEENLKKLGEPFFSTRTKGVGLGLYISYQIVKKHKGRIEVRSKMNKGTSFTIFLPKK